MRLMLLFLFFGLCLSCCSFETVIEEDICAPFGTWDGEKCFYPEIQCSEGEKKIGDNKCEREVATVDGKCPFPGGKLRDGKCYYISEIFN